MSGYGGRKRSTSARTQHRKTHPPRMCAACGVSGPGVKLEQDHKTNLAAGGPDVPANYQWLCARPPHGNGCHWQKTQTEIAAGKAAAIAKRGSLSRKYRDLETHPGRIPK